MTSRSSCAIASFACGACDAIARGDSVAVTCTSNERPPPSRNPQSTFVRSPPTARNPELELFRRILRYRVGHGPHSAWTRRMMPRSSWRIDPTPSAPRTGDTVSIPSNATTAHRIALKSSLAHQMRQRGGLAKSVAGIKDRPTTEYLGGAFQKPCSVSSDSGSGAGWRFSLWSCSRSQSGIGITGVIRDVPSVSSSGSRPGFG